MHLIISLGQQTRNSVIT